MENNHDLGFQKFIRGIILVGFTLLLFKLILTGDITNFIAPKMLPFVYFAAAVFLILGILQIWRSDSKKELDIYCDCGLDHSGKSSPIKSLAIYSVFLFPVLTGFMFPEVVLDSSVIKNRGINLGTASVQAEQTETTESSAETKTEKTTATQEAKSADDMYLEGLLNSDKIVVTDAEYSKITNYIEMNLDKFEGKEIELVGFVYREPDYKQDEMAISRFTVSCCVADLQVMGTLATGEAAKNLKNDEWIKVTGTITKTTRNEQELPLIDIGNIEKIEAPSDPYIYVF
ncbi:TIGR03943 family putative permease subunit [Metabacillus malikii]|uniref:Membrane protein n=1 Tax=Metabacillus malikii TaxID=1504265 RepID=A0ABT9ZIN8_9BACI|nr:TIGR03943 family protein [Metabacillus malikii]MDQ0232139.1 putative membrane protein [Metabacillus malikii]